MTKKAVAPRAPKGYEIVRSGWVRATDKYEDIPFGWQECGVFYSHRPWHLRIPKNGNPENAKPGDIHRWVARPVKVSRLSPKRRSK